MNISPPRFLPLPCARCAAWIHWPRWARVSPNRYQCLCWPCFDAIDLDFTPAAAIEAARAIVCRAGIEAWL